MGRTIPSFRLALAMEERRWKLYRRALGKQKDRKEFDEMFAIPRLYSSACSYAAQPVRLCPILMSILLHCWIEMSDCSKELEQMATKIDEEGLKCKEKKKENKEVVVF